MYMSYVLHILLFSGGNQWQDDLRQVKSVIQHQHEIRSFYCNYHKGTTLVLIPVKEMEIVTLNPPLCENDEKAFLSILFERMILQIIILYTPHIPTKVFFHIKSWIRLAWDAIPHHAKVQNVHPNFMIFKVMSLDVE